MIGFLTIVHILIAISLCALVLVQDSKGGGALGIGGSGSNSLLGATGAQTLASKMTRYVAILFAASCVGLTYFLAHENKSVIDQLGSPTISAPNTTETKPSVPGPDDNKSPTAAATAEEKPTSSKNSPPTSGQPAANDKK